MKLQTMQQVKLFQDTIQKCNDPVWLISGGDKYNLKSALSQIVAIGRVMAGDETLELFAETKVDEAHFMEMFYAHPEMV